VPRRTARRGRSRPVRAASSSVSSRCRPRWRHSARRSAARAPAWRNPATASCSSRSRRQGSRISARTIVGSSPTAGPRGR
jgi:hypothetical protein